MKYAVISDIHANLTALDAILADASQNGAESVVCLGDIVGYGPMPAESLHRIRECCRLTIAGNHDDAVSGRGSADGFVNLASEAVDRHRHMLSQDEKRYLSDLPYCTTFGNAIATHGDFTDPEKFYYVDNEDDALLNFKATDAQLMFVGHTHVPCIFVVGNSGRIHRLPPQDFMLENGKRYIVNPGSVGYPRESDGKCLSSYVIYDSTDRSVIYRMVPFAISGVMQRGVFSRRIGRLLIAAAGITALIVLGFIALRFASHPAPPPAVVTVIAERTADKPIATKSVTLASSVNFVCPKVRLKRDSAPLLLNVIFKDALGQSVGNPYTKLIKKSSAAWIRIPHGAISAHATLSSVSQTATHGVDIFDLLTADKRPAPKRHPATSSRVRPVQHDKHD